MKIQLSNGKEIYLDGYLKSALDSLIWNVKNDWDFVLIVTGDGMVRTGKSVLAMNIGAYLAERLKTNFSDENIFFDSKEMINFAQKNKYTVVQYDEAREGLASVKRFTQIQQDLVDYFNECGQNNNLFILVLPDFFSLNWELATNRSECLINVYRREENTTRIMNGEDTPVTVFHRGYFAFYNRNKKAKLYWKGKKSGIRDYGCIIPNFRGSFTNNYPVDEELYRSKKKEALARFDERHKVEKKEKLRAGEKVAYRLLTRLKGRLRELAREDGLDEHYYGNVLSELRKKAGDVGEITSPVGDYTLKLPNEEEILQ